MGTREFSCFLTSVYKSDFKKTLKWLVPEKYLLNSSCVTFARFLQMLWVTPGNRHELYAALENRPKP